MNSSTTSSEIETALRKQLGPTFQPNSSAGPPVKTGIHPLDHSTSKAPICKGSLIELVGASRTGKTRLLHVITANVLTSPTVVASDNCQPVCCWYDLNHSLDINFLYHLIQAKLSIVGTNETKKIKSILKRLYIYKIKDTPELLMSLKQLKPFLQTPQGAHINTIIIDSLGSFHYIDKYCNDALFKHGELPREIMLTDNIKQLLSLKSCVVYVSRCAIFEMEKLNVQWPFKNAGIPSIPKQFMPEVWTKIVTHVILLYDIHDKQLNLLDLTKMGMLCMWYQDLGKRRQLSVLSASVLQISSADVTCDPDQTYVL